MTLGELIDQSKKIKDIFLSIEVSCLLTNLSRYASEDSVFDKFHNSDIKREDYYDYMLNEFSVEKICDDFFECIQNDPWKDSWISKMREDSSYWDKIVKNQSKFNPLYTDVMLNVVKIVKIKEDIKEYQADADYLRERLQQLKETGDPIWAEHAEREIADIKECLKTEFMDKGKDYSDEEIDLFYNQASNEEFKEALVYLINRGLYYKKIEKMQAELEEFDKAQNLVSLIREKVDVYKKSGDTFLMQQADTLERQIENADEKLRDLLFKFADKDWIREDIEEAEKLRDFIFEYADTDIRSDIEQAENYIKDLAQKKAANKISQELGRQRSEGERIKRTPHTRPQRTMKI